MLFKDLTEIEKFCIVLRHPRIWRKSCYYFGDYKVKTAKDFLPLIGKIIVAIAQNDSFCFPEEIRDLLYNLDHKKREYSPALDKNVLQDIENLKEIAGFIQKNHQLIDVIVDKLYEDIPEFLKIHKLSRSQYDMTRYCNNMNSRSYYDYSLHRDVEKTPQIEKILSIKNFYFHKIILEVGLIKPDLRLSCAIRIIDEIQKPKLSIDTLAIKSDWAKEEIKKAIDENKPLSKYCNSNISEQIRARINQAIEVEKSIDIFPISTFLKNYCKKLLTPIEIEK